MRMPARALWGGSGTLSATLTQRARSGARWGGLGGLGVDATVLKGIPHTATLYGQAGGPLTITGHN
jgi:hypothetical protein